MRLDEHLEAKGERDREAYYIKTDEEANWALRKIAKHQAQLKQNNELAQAEIDKIKEWQTSENKKESESVDYFQSLLAVYATVKRENDPKFKSKAFPNGKIKYTKQQPLWTYNEKEILQALKETGTDEFIRLKEEVDKKTIKELFNVDKGRVYNPHTGEQLAGIIVEEREDKFVVEVRE